ncbi:MAG: ribonuclease HII [Candidatus Komeilibacteria bacterium]|nr:ribonuclease HII [Candidatus Komeilibacteria bacterium]
MEKCKIAIIVGVDEVGRGALAGPLVAAAVAVRDARRFPIGEVRDSKLLSDRDRRRLVPLLTQSCEIHYGIVSNRLIDRIGIQAANALAIDMALQAFCNGEYALHSDHVASFHKLTTLAISVELHVHGESVVPEIAAASIAAKVFRDDLMIGLHQEHSGYNFAQHKGYGTAEHRARLRRFGFSPVHRRSFAM